MRRKKAHPANLGAPDEARHMDVTAQPVAPAALNGRPAADGSDCERVAPVLARIGDKWSMLVVVLLGAGPRRFNELKRAVDGISQRMLSLTLRRLERDGLVSRSVTPTMPPRVDYALTNLGRSLRDVVDTLAAWARVNQAAMADAQRRYDGAARRSFDGD